VIKVF